MPTYIVLLKDGVPPDEIKIVKQQAIEQGGKIEQEYTIIPGFSVRFDNDAITTLESNENVKVELDGVATTQ
ncbi:hypothetical protein CDD83_4653 [Cordyceps sp. RAO-2017]|nr:hypothetical protein CDD83_4653 [Cordyceps sp. RAO-2017]